MKSVLAFACILSAAMHVIYVARGSDIYANEDFSLVNSHRKLQFEGMFEGNNQKRGKRKPVAKVTRSQALTKAVAEIILESDRYHQWWAGPSSENDFFKPVEWAATHNPEKNAIFTMAVIQGQDDKASCSSP